MEKSRDHENRIRTLELGVYGDEKNEIPGLITRGKQHEKHIEDIRQWQKSISTKVVYFSLGAGVVISGIIWVIEQFVQSIK